jgi:hypothetical protein
MMTILNTAQSWQSSGKQMYRPDLLGRRNRPIGSNAKEQLVIQRLYNFPGGICRNLE